MLIKQSAIWNNLPQFHNLFIITVNDQVLLLLWLMHEYRLEFILHCRTGQFCLM